MPSVDYATKQGNINVALPVYKRKEDESMRFTIQAACSCNKGKVRANNEDNFYFDGKSLPAENNGLRNPVCFEDYIKHGLCHAVFDGMGGENFGELASFAAAEYLRNTEKTLADYFVPEKKYLKELCNGMNKAVVDVAAEQGTTRMGTTMVAFYYTSRYVYVCNLGDSRAFQLRSGVFAQVSQDHVESLEDSDNARKRKPALMQYLGIDPEEFLLEPYIIKAELKRGDKYLLCSDGLTDMLSNVEISDILIAHDDVEECVEALIQAALDKGGKDNVTVIVSKIC